ncbi:MAG: TolC family protein [Sphingopyxis sp.]|uniref:TolC family protein n=1 Tax=Sphingopyxis sp. TaxID=1908224 RepID=UPI002AB88F4A|nr:TolC family protein [Sphingopyxis sp.]MDZ3832812.1 TolC family protein [Sphingopyxis sp.]
MTARPSLSAILLIVAAPCQAQDIDVLPLDFGSAQQRLIEQSDAIAAQDANLRAKEAQEGATRSLHRPDVDIEAQLLEYQKTLYLPLGSLAPIAAPFGIRDPLRFRQERTATRPIVTATLPIYTGGQISATQAGARAQVGEARAARAATLNDQLHRLSQAYFGQQLAEHVLAVRRDVVAGLERHVSDAEKLEREGFISRAQMLQAEVARDDAARELEKAKADLATANALLAGLLRAPGGVRPTSPLAVDSRPLEPLDEFKTAALNNHPQIERLHAVEEQARAGVGIQKSKLRPTVYGFGQYNFDRRNSLLTDPDWSVGVGVKYKLFSGTGRQQMVEAAQHSVAQAQAGLREIQTQVAIGVTKNWGEADAARRRFLLLDSTLASAEENLRLQRLSYREQQATSLDVVDAELGLGKALTDRTKAAFDYIQALSDLLYSCGQMDRLPAYLDRADKVIA